MSCEKKTLHLCGSPNREAPPVHLGTIVPDQGPGGSAVWRKHTPDESTVHRLTTSRNSVSKQPETEGASREPGTFWLRGVGGRHVPQAVVHGRLEIIEVFDEPQGDELLLSSSSWM